MMYYRRKIILSLFQQIGKDIGKTKFQKLLFLFTRMQDTPSYDFVPYKFGCYSFQAIYDIGALIKKNYLREVEGNWIKETNDDYISQLERNDASNLNSLLTQYADFSLTELIRHIYSHYPYYAINSEIAEQYISKEVLDVHRPENDSNNHHVFTIGYEGASIESYVNRLISKNIELLVDVRNNPVSMKTGFSKKQLENIMSNFSIMYMHLPTLGIPSPLRKKYLTKESKDYTGLFDIYKNEILNNASEELNLLKDLVDRNNRIALTCFEKDPECCHRKIIAESITQDPVNI
jgi:uncharacterized protein (DUF488 family)